MLSPGGEHRSGANAGAVPSPSGPGPCSSAGVHVTEKPEGVRISTHFYNNEHDVDSCVEALAEYRERLLSRALPSARGLVQCRHLEPFFPRRGPPRVQGKRGPRGVPGRREGHLSESRHRHRREHPDPADSGGKISLYKLRILSNDSRVWVPQQNADGVGLRPVIRPADVRKIFTILGDGTIDQHSNWKGRFKENSDKMRTGSLFEVAEVLKGLTFLSRSKALSFREKRMLDRAKFLLVSEIAEAEDKTRTAVEERVDRALEKTFGVRAEADPEAGGPGQARQRLTLTARRYCRGVQAPSAVLQADPLTRFCSLFVPDLPQRTQPRPAIPRGCLDFGGFAGLESAVLPASDRGASELVDMHEPLEPQ